MTHFRILGAALALSALGAAGLLLGAARAPAAPRAETLHATVGPGFTITLRKDDGSSVTRLDPGPYTIAVDDQSDIHNFHLTGPGVNQATDVEGTGTTTWNVTFTNGTYTFVCDVHPTMKGSFVVGSGSSTTTTTTGTPPPPLPTLTATVGPGFTIGVKRLGKAVKRLPSGRYRIVVRDLSSSHDFHLLGPGVNRKTAVARRGTTTWTLTLRAGTYVYRCDPHRATMHGSFKVTSIG